MIADREEQEHYSHLEARKIQTSRGFFILYECRFTLKSSRFPSRAWLKLFSAERLTEYHKEQCMLIELNDPEKPIAIPKFLYNFFNKEKRPCLFISAFETILEDEVGRRASARNFWAESEIWQHAIQLAEVVFALHSRRIVHRNICPASIFLREGKLFLGHFDDSKQIAAGVSEQLQTLRGCILWLSPEAFAGVNSRSFTTYEDALKDDIWGYGVVLLVIATLNKQDTLNQHFSLPPEKFASYITSLLAAHYSPRLASFIAGLLILDGKKRPSSDDLLEFLRNYFMAKPCRQCRQWVYHVNRTALACGHAYCESCMTLRVVNQTEGVIACHCDTIIPFSYLLNLPDATRSLIFLCKSCGSAIKKRTSGRGEEETYSFRCACERMACKVCHQEGGHHATGESCPSGHASSDSKPTS